VTIRFKKQVFGQRVLDPNNGFQPVVLPLEIRWDTLTGRTSTIQEFRFRGNFPKPDYTALIEKTRPICPFCPEALSRVSPRFPPELVPEGWLEHRGVTVIPNFNPYATYSAIAVLSRSHFLELTDFTEDIVANGLAASQQLLRRIAAADRKARYMSVNCNYLPPAGGSVIHPHFQPIAGYVAPTYEREMIAGVRRYHRKYGGNYWADLIQTEKELGERFVGQTGSVAWLMNFAARGRDPDIMAVFEGKNSILELTEEDLRGFSTGLISVFRYLAGKNYGPFNMALYSAPPGEDQFRAYARIKPRFQFPPVGTADHCYIETLHDENFCQSYPEAVCRDLRPYFSQIVEAKHAAGH